MPALCSAAIERKLYGDKHKRASRRPALYIGSKCRTCYCFASSMVQAGITTGRFNLDAARRARLINKHPQHYESLLPQLARLGGITRQRLSEVFDARNQFRRTRIGGCRYNGCSYRNRNCSLGGAPTGISINGTSGIGATMSATTALTSGGVQVFCVAGAATKRTSTGFGDKVNWMRGPIDSSAKTTTPCVNKIAAATTMWRKRS